MKRNKKIGSLIAVTLVMIMSVQCVFAGNIITDVAKKLMGTEEKVAVKLNGNTITFPDAQPFIDGNSRTLVPIRFIAEAMGGTVLWNDPTETVTIIKGNKTIGLKIGEYGATVNGQRWALDTSAILKEDRTFVPLRFVSEILGTTIGWDESTCTVSIIDSSINYKPSPAATPTPTPTPDSNSSSVKVDTNFDVSVNPICEKAFNVSYYKGRIANTDGSYTFTYYSIDDKVDITFTFVPNSTNFLICMMWASDNDYAVLGELLNIVSPDIHDDVIQMAQERVGWQESNFRGAVGDYTVTIVHNSDGAIPKDEQGVNIRIN